MIFSIFKTIKSDKNEKQLKLENNYVIGEITEYNSIGLEASYYIHFTYIVDGIRYEKSVNKSSVHCDCQHTKYCIGFMHPVYYDIENPKNAFMDFSLTELEFNRENFLKVKLGKRLKELEVN